MQSRKCKLKFSKGQLSLEAMVSFSILLSCLAILLFSAQELSTAFSSSVLQSHQSLQASSDAFAIDAAGSFGKSSSLPFKLSTTPKGSKLVHLQNPSISEQVFHKVFVDKDGIYVQTDGLEPI